MRRNILVASLLLLLAGFFAPGVLAHGTSISYTTDMAVIVVAAFDTGEPMDGAQVTVYAPGDPLNPWLTGTCNDEGEFLFVPDRSQPGNWEVKVRKSGHGAIMTVPVTTETDAAGGLSIGGATPTYTPAQVALMSGMVVWGCIGTALFFANRRH